MGGPKEQLNKDNIMSRDSEVILPYRKPIHPCTKGADFESTYDCPVKDINSQSGFVC